MKIEIEKLAGDWYVSGDRGKTWILLPLTPERWELLAPTLGEERESLREILFPGGGE